MIDLVCLAGLKLDHYGGSRSRNTTGILNVYNIFPILSFVSASQGHLIKICESLVESGMMFILDTARGDSPSNTSLIVGQF